MPRQRHRINKRVEVNETQITHEHNGNEYIITITEKLLASGPTYGYSVSVRNKEGLLEIVVLIKNTTYGFTDTLITAIEFVEKNSNRRNSILRDGNRPL
jgi:hypothetical protein